MKRSALILCLALYSIISFSQSVPFPPDSELPRDGNLHPYGYQQVGTPGSFNTSPFLPFWWNGLRMRIMPPNGVTYTNLGGGNGTWNIQNPGVKYPLILFFHGNGESGFDNNNQLKHGGQKHMQAVQSGAFPGFLLYPQDVTYDQGKQLVEEMIATLPIDINRIYVHGLSGGGGKTWQFAIHYPTLVAAAFPMSATDAGAKTQTLLYQPFRESQGALDTNPSPTQSQDLVNYMNNNGGHLEYFVLANTGHGTWDAMYNRADFFPWFLQQKKNKIFVRFDKNLICPQDPISVDMGFTPGFDAYEWRKDGVLINGATQAKYIATAYGSYTGRIKNRGVWSDWSDPVTVGPKPTTNTPPITTNGLKSTVLPAPDGSTTTELDLPDGYVSYTWKNASNQTVSTSQIFTNVPVGSYTATAMEVNGCATNPSPVFQVISADGPNKPDGVASVLAYAPSQTSVALSWTDNPSPAFNETAFEIYRSKSEQSGYALVGITGADVISFTDNNLISNTTYYYKIRPINSTSAGPVSDPVGVLTQVDDVAPTAPSNLVVTATSPTTISLSWNASTDNIAVYRYDIYKDGAKVLSLPTTSTTATIYNLIPNTTYEIVVKARDLAGNSSTESNLVMANSVLAGWNYSYYELSSAPSSLPNFNLLAPKEIGTSSSLDVSVRDRTTNNAFQWSGFITLPNTGSYTFVLNGARGDRLYINNILVVDDDGNHSARDKEGTRTFTAGTYPVLVQTYGNGSAASMAPLAWKNTANGVGNTKTTIPLSYFTPTVVPAGTAPTPPTNLSATAVAFNKINLTWTDASNNETGFRVYRATANTGPFLPVASVGAGTTSYQDTGLTGNTTYYYRVTAFGEFGESGLSTQVPRGFTCSYYEAPSLTSISQFANLVPKKIVTEKNFFDATLGAIRERNENFGIKFVGKINITTAATYTFYASTDDGSTILIDGTQVVSNDTDGNQHEKSGTKALTVGWHDIVVNWRKRTSSNSRITISMARPGLSKFSFSSSNGNTWFVGTEINAKTPVTPPAPLVATNVNVSDIGPFSMKLNWQDNATNETSYQVLRSYKTNQSYVVYKNLPANTTSFTDQDLFANATYFYKVVAIGDGGQTTSSEVSGITSNNVPDLTPINDIVLKYGKTIDVNVYSEDSDNDPITLEVLNLPAFATFTNHGDGSGVIHFTPAIGDLGAYTITVTASDNHSGSESDPFVFTVTDKDTPSIGNIPTTTVSEGQTGSLFIGATSDYGAANLTWAFDGLPEFASYNVDENGVCTVSLSPGYIHSGPYTVQVTVTDPQGTSASKTFTINVTNVDPNQKWSVNISGGSNGPAPWNNVTTGTVAGLRNQLNAVTSVGMQFQTPAWNIFNQGAVTGNNSGVFPDNVLREYYYFGIFGAPETVDVRMTGLDPNIKYTFSFMASSVWNGVADNGSTVFKIGTQGVALRAQSNSTGLGVITGVNPAADGSITFSMSKARGTEVGFLNGFTMEAVYQDGTAPAPPRAVTASLVNGAVNLNWVDAPFNEDGYDVYRAASVDGPFEKINASPLPKNTTSYSDGTVTNGTSYVYKLKAFNLYGESDFSNAATFDIVNMAPKIVVAGDLTILPSTFAMLNVSATEGTVLTISGLPEFAFESPTSSSASDIILLPEPIHTGNYTFQATAVDDTGLSTTQNVTFTVGEEVLYRVYLNFNSGNAGGIASSPWNNTNKQPAVNDVFANLKNTDNANSGISVTLLDAPGGAYNEGAQTGNNSGAVPDAVLKEYYWFGIFNASPTVRLRISGLSPTNRYRLKFISSSVFTNNGTITNNGTTRFTAGSQTASVAVQNNTQNFAVLNDLITNSQGQILVTASKGANTAAGYINGMILEALPIDVSKFNPSDLTAAGYSKTEVVLNWADNSPIETGYEIQRSTTGAEGSFTVIGTTGPDISTYTDTPGTGNQLYHYRVRATTADGPSQFTNVAKSSVVAFKILVNISIEPKGGESFDAPVPWNNIGKFGFTGDVFVGFKDDNGLPTGLRMRVQTQLEGGNNWGPTTGDNSGVVPDKVLRAFWFNDAYFPQGEFIIDNLDQTFSYNFGFMGSIDVTNAVNTDFSINGRTVTNRNDQNETNISYLRDVKPDANSEILFTVKETAGSPWSIWNALIIEGFATGGTSNGRVASTARDDGNIYEVRYGEATNKLSFYPNPVRDIMNLKIEDTSYGTIKYEFYDLTGRVAQSGEMTNSSINPEYQIGVDLPAAMYIMKVVYPDGRFETQRFIKN